MYSAENIEKKMNIILNQKLSENDFALPEEEYLNLFFADLQRNIELGVPKDYIDFLHKYGIGDLCSFFSIDSELRSSKDVFSHEISDLKFFYFFATDIGEYLYAFDSENNWNIVEVDSSGNITEYLSNSFSKFIEKILDEIID